MPAGAVLLAVVMWLLPQGEKPVSGVGFIDAMKRARVSGIACQAPDAKKEVNAGPVCNGRNADGLSPYRHAGRGNYHI